MRRINSVIGVALLAIAGVRLAAQAPSAATKSSVVTGAVPAVARADGRRLPSSHDAPVTSIRGNVFDAANGPMVNMTVRLRDARFGRIIDTQVTDKVGMFAFTPADPGSYIVEVMGDDRTVLAASDIIDVNTGDAATTIVKLPLRVRPPSSGLGGKAASAAAIVAAAASAGVLATTVTGNEVSQRKAF
jgi:hypothetical protein